MGEECGTATWEGWVMWESWVTGGGMGNVESWVEWVLWETTWGELSLHREKKGVMKRVEWNEGKEMVEWPLLLLLFWNIFIKKVISPSTFSFSHS